MAKPCSNLRARRQVFVKATVSSSLRNLYHSVPPATAHQLLTHLLGERLRPNRCSAHNPSIEPTQRTPMQTNYNLSKDPLQYAARSLALFSNFCYDNHGISGICSFLGLFLWMCAMNSIMAINLLFVCAFEQVVCFRSCSELLTSG